MPANNTLFDGHIFAGEDSEKVVVEDGVDDWI